MTKLILFITIFFLASCASETAKMAHQVKIDKNNIYKSKNSTECKNFKAENVKKEDQIFNSRLIATPIIGILGIFAAPAIIAANIII